MTSAELTFQVLDRLGVFVFALSGGLAAVRLRMDAFGVLVVAFLPAVGGGTLRDVLLDEPVFWLSDTWSLGFAAAGAVLAFLAPNFWPRLKVLTWADAVGLSLFAVLGAAKAYELGHGMVVTVIMGTMTATAGGLIRDVVCNQPPLLLHEDIYATAAMAGAAAFWVAASYGLAAPWSLILGAMLVLTIRSAAIVFKLSLPTSLGPGSK